MNRWLATVMLVVVGVSLIFACSSPQPTAEEMAMMEALKNIQTNVQTNVSYEQYGKLLDGAKQKLAVLKASASSNPCFLNAVTKSSQFYEICKDAWRKKDTATDEITRSDMEMTLNLTFGFASVSLARAQECLKAD